MCFLQIWSVHAVVVLNNNRDHRKTMAPINMHKTIAIYLLVQHYQYYIRIQAPYTADKSVTDLLQTFKEQICYKPVTDELSVRTFSTC